MYHVQVKCDDGISRDAVIVQQDDAQIWAAAQHFDGDCFWDEYINRRRDTGLPKWTVMVSPHVEVFTRGNFQSWPAVVYLKDGAQGAMGDRQYIERREAPVELIPLDLQPCAPKEGWFARFFGK